MTAASPVHAARMKGVTPTPIPGSPMRYPRVRTGAVSLALGSAPSASSLFAMSIGRRRLARAGAGGPGSSVGSSHRRRRRVA